MTGSAGLPLRGQIGVKMTVVLASGSPRRKQLMEMLGFKNMEIIPAKGEEVINPELTPGRLVESLAEEKAKEVAALRAENDLIIAADTIVWSEGRVLGKPRSEKDAEEMLRSLSGKTHEVYTGVCIIKDGELFSEHEMSRVRFRELSESEIKAYVKTGEPMDKAGAYGAQGKGALFIKGIEGDFFNVMGLPVCRLGEMLKKQGVRIL